MKTLNVIIIVGISIFLVSCGSMTRTEMDTFTITNVDTTFTYTVQNAPGNRDNGVIYPSSRVLLKEREQLNYDSIVERDYPDFIRLGVFESVGIIGGDKNVGIGTGLFGIFPELKDLDPRFRGRADNQFPGGIYRIGIGEWRLRWFRDSKNWTIGTSLYEALVPDARGEKTLMSFLPLYIKKRYYLREEIPYIALSPSFGLGYYPSIYANISGALEVGSIGGLNMRLYAGFAAGYNPSWSPQIANNDFTKDGQSSVFPYFGLGISFLDFHNLVKETYKEWKEYEHSSWDVGLAQFTFLTSGSRSSVFAKSDTNSIITGFIGKFLNADVALPILDNKFYLGTSFVSLYATGYNEWCMGILPIRLGYWHTLLRDELSISPYIETAFFPSYYFNFGLKMNLAISQKFNININGGYISAEPIGAIGDDLLNNFGSFATFSKVYIGIGISVFDRIFFPEQLRYNKK